MNRYPSGKVPTAEMQRQWCDAVMLKRVKDLNEWETTFISNIDDLLDLEVKLTEDQIWHLEKIYARVTG